MTSIHTHAVSTPDEHAAAGAPWLPLVVDLDGTLIRSDTLHESVLRLLREKPLDILHIPSWLLHGKAALKHEIAERVEIDVAVLPYHAELLPWLREQKAQGRRLILATASAQRYAQAVADHLGLFDEVWASDADHNLRGSAKCARAVAEFGERGFCYAGDAQPDLAVWAKAGAAVPVNTSNKLAARAAALAPIERRFDKPATRPGVWFKAIRVHQWLKNLLIFLPLLAAHAWHDAHRAVAAMLAFLAFSFVASAIYLVNDLLDLPDDRHHASKRRRPLAAGLVSIPAALIASLALLLAASALTTQLPWRFSGVLMAYLALTLSYSFALKRLMVLDVMVLGVLYAIRLVAGATAVAVPLSFWLLAFSMSLFFSLALLKRYSELIALRRQGVLKRTRGRGYHVEDIEMLASLGSASGYGAVLVLALYINSTTTSVLYHEPRYIWLACPALLYWLTRAWMLAHRGQMHDDPVVFAARDKASWLLLAGMAAAFWLAL